MHGGEVNMFTKLGRFTVRRRGIVLLATLATLALSGVVGGGVADRLSRGGFDAPGSDSVRASTELDQRFDTGFADLVILATVADEFGTVDHPDAVIAGRQLTNEIAGIDGTDDVVSYWSTGDPAMRSIDGRRAVMLLRLPGDQSGTQRDLLVSDLLDTYRFTERGPLTVELAGREAVFEQMSTVIEDDLALAEAIAIPAIFILLVLVFGGVVAALLPVGVGVMAAFSTFLVLYLVSATTDVSIFALNLVTALGLGLAIDYSLFIVSRFREERQGGLGVDEAVIRTVETAGRTVAFSALTVAVSLAALLVFPLFFLRSFAYAGVGVVVLAMTTSVVALPALLSLLGDRVNRWAILGYRERRHAVNRWRELGQTMTARPWPVIVMSVVLLVAVAIPFLGVKWGEGDQRVLPADDPVREVTEVLASEFSSTEGNAFPIVAVGNIEPSAITGLAIRISALDGVSRVDAATGSFAGGVNLVASDDDSTRFEAPDASWLNVVPDLEPISAEAEQLIAEIRALDTTFDEVLVGGGTAALVDTKEAIFDRVWIAALLIVAATFVLLFLMFNSILVPIKAIVLNTLSLGATFGMMVWIFQDGHGADLLGFTPTGFTDITTPILMFCIAFGLSMDYEVFLLSRMKEEYDRTGDNDRAVVEGLAKTGKLVTAAAVLLSITFLAFATSGVSTIKLFGLGLAVAVLVDAFIVRVTLVPALMTVAGRWNWWAPAPLRRVHTRFGISEQAPPFDEAEIDLREIIDLSAAEAIAEPAAEETTRPVP